MWTCKIPQGLTHGQDDVVTCGPGEDATVKTDQALQALQWQYGKLRLQWKSLLSAQEEGSKFTHRASHSTHYSLKKTIMKTAYLDLNAEMK